MTQPASKRLVVESSLAPVARSGEYGDLQNKPTIPPAFNPIAGANISLSGTYPNITIASTGGGGGPIEGEVYTTEDKAKVDGLDDALAAKANTVHGHTASQITDFEDAVQAITGGSTGADGYIADKIKIDKADEADRRRLAASRAAQMQDIITSDELVEKWYDLTKWKTLGTITTANNKLQGGTNAKALRSWDFDWAGGEVGRVRVTGGKTSSNTSANHFLALDFGTKDHVPGTGDKYLGIGINSSGNLAAFAQNMGAIDFEFLPTTPLAGNGPGSFPGTPNPPVNWTMSIDIGPETVSFTVTDDQAEAGDHGQVVLVVQRASLNALGLDYVNIFLSVAAASGDPLTFGPLVAMKHLNKSRDPELKALDSVTNRWVIPKYAAAGEKWMYELPTDYDPLVGSPLIIFCHQSITGDWDEPWDDADATKHEEWRKGLIAAGFILASAYDGEDRWGNQASLDNYYALYEYISTHHNVSDVFLFASSMGTLPALNLVNHRKFPTPRALGSVGALTNFQAVWDEHIEAGGGYSAHEADVKAAYGFTNDADFEVATAGYRPEDYEGWAYRGVPMKFWIGQADNVVEDGNGGLEHAVAFKNKLTPFSDPVEVPQDISGNHGQLESYDAASIIEWFSRFKTTSPTQTEGIVISSLLERLTDLENQVPLVAPVGTVNTASLPDKKPLFEYET